MRDIYDEYMLKLLQKVADAMAKKLADYKADQLPGGKFWNPDDESLKKALQSLPPTNDVAESILGLNDWLFKHNPNFKQRTVSTLVEVMKNSSLKWLQQQEEEVQERIITLAKKRKRDVVLRDEQEQEQQRQARIKLREDAIEKAIQKNERIRKENDRVKAIIPVTSVADLEEQLLKIQCSTQKKTEMAELHFLRDQIQYKTTKKVPLTVKGKKRSTSELKEELVRLLEENTLKNKLNSRIRHRLSGEDDSEECTWYDGLVINTSEKSLTIKYDGDDERLEWTYEQICEDVQNGDFIWL